MPSNVVQLRCPHCAHVFMVTGGQVSSPTIDCPACGRTIHRTTAAGGRLPEPKTRDTVPPPTRTATHSKVPPPEPPPPRFGSPMRFHVTPKKHDASPSKNTVQAEAEARGSVFGAAPKPIPDVLRPTVTPDTKEGT